MKSGWKRFDRILNITLVICFALWAIGFILEQSEKGTLSLEEAARRAFESVDAPALGGPGLHAERLSAPMLHKWIQESDRPALFMIFASWCPYCKQLIPDLIALQAEEPEKFRLAAMTIDHERQAIDTYLASQPALAFPVYFFEPEYYTEIGKFLHSFGMRYTGGVPYMVLFSNGKPVREFNGAIDKETLRAMLREAHAHQLQAMEKISSDARSKTP